MYKQPIALVTTMPTTIMLNAEQQRTDAERDVLIRLIRPVSVGVQ